MRKQDFRYLVLKWFYKLNLAWFCVGVAIVSLSTLGGHVEYSLPKWVIVLAGGPFFLFPAYYLLGSRFCHKCGAWFGLKTKYRKWGNARVQYQCRYCDLKVNRDEEGFG